MKDKHIDLVDYGAWGYVIIKDNTIFCPAIMITEGHTMKDIFDKIVKETGIKKIIFSSVISPMLRAKLKNIKKEWAEYSELHKDYINFIEVEWKGE